MTGSRDWRERAGRTLLSPIGPLGEPIMTPIDRRWLWRIENTLAVCAPMRGVLDEMRQDLRAYLNETCEHHWIGYEGDGEVPAHNQCLWCNKIDWLSTDDQS